MEWIKCSEREPEESGNYLITNVISDGIGYVAFMQYSAAHKMWNAHDNQSAEQAQVYAMHPAFWQPMPELPEGVKAC